MEVQLELPRRGCPPGCHGRQDTDALTGRGRGDRLEQRSEGHPVWRESGRVCAKEPARPAAPPHAAWMGREEGSGETEETC